MLKRFFFILFMCLFSASPAQINLVPNPSFESYTLCPDNWAQITRASGWNTAGASPDYYNACASAGSFSVPGNAQGYQLAADGNAYVGIRTYARGDNSNYSIYREVIVSSLSSSLTIGQKYFVSFKVSLTLNNIESGVAVNKTGALFTTYPLVYTGTDSTDAMPTNKNFAHIYTDSIITDTANWTMIAGSFVADSGYSHIYIGNFFENQNTDTIIFNPDSLIGCCSYYYVDDVRVSTDSNFVYTEIQEESLKNNLNIYPNPVTDYFHINQAFPEPYDLVIYNALGQKLFQEKNIAVQNKAINATLFTNGILFLTIKSSSQSINYKVVKQ